MEIKVMFGRLVIADVKAKAVYIGDKLLNGTNDTFWWTQEFVSVELNKVKK